MTELRDIIRTADKADLTGFLAAIAAMANMDDPHLSPLGRAIFSEARRRTQATPVGGSDQVDPLFIADVLACSEEARQAFAEMVGEDNTTDGGLKLLWLAFGNEIATIKKREQLAATIAAAVISELTEEH